MRTEAAPAASGSRCPKSFGGGAGPTNAQCVEDLTVLCKCLAEGERRGGHDSGRILRMLQGLRAARDLGHSADSNRERAGGGAAVVDQGVETTVVLCVCQWRGWSAHHLKSAH